MRGRPGATLDTLASLLRALLACISAGALAPARVGAQRVLVYDDNSTYGHARTACIRLGLSCTRAVSADFVTQLEGSSWDLVVLDLPSVEPAGAWQPALASYVSRGGRAIHSHWNPSSLAELPATFQVTIGSSHDAIAFHRWSASVLFAAPEVVPDSFTAITDVWGTNGFYLTPIAPAYAAAGFTTTPTSGQAAIVIGNGDRTIFNGFLFDDFTGDDGDGIPDIVELIANEIAFLLGGSAPTEPCVGRPEGAACTTASGASGTCRGGGCCTGCWNGTRCQVGTAASACGVAGAPCVNCADADACTADVCSAGACSHPPAPAGTTCDDGMFCTAVDRCDGSGICIGNGARCDDGEDCTTDVCDETMDRCTHVTDSGCSIGGACVAEGTVHPAYPCLVCERARNPNDWSPRAAGTICGAARCVGGRLQPASVCDASGTCVAPPSMRCATGRCADATSCETSCADTGCPEGEWCAPSGACMPRLPDGSTCIADEACASGACTDGVCCDEPCDGTCERCDLEGSVGACTPVPAGMDPDRECGAGRCDGAGNCASGLDAAPPARDAGSQDADAGAPPMDASPIGIDAGTTTRSRSGGCGCGVSSSGGTELALVVLALALALRRRLRP